MEKNDYYIYFEAFNDFFIGNRKSKKKRRGTCNNNLAGVNFLSTRASLHSTLR